MDSHEDYLDALTAYSRNPTEEIPPILDQYLNGVAKNGETLFQWPLLKPLIVGKMDQVIGELRQGLSSENIPPRPNVENVRFDVMHARIMDALHKFNGAPFTIQRLCELLVDPKRHYKRSDKFMRGLEKNVLVVSTVDPFGRKVVSESGNKHLVNGMDTNGSPFFPRDSNISSNLPPVPGWVTSPVSSASRPQISPAIDSTEQKPTRQTAHDSSPSNGVSTAMVGSLYTDHGEQPLAVHAEEVVEETVVTMDTNEVGSVATGAGEALAEEEEEEEMGVDDTNASSSSSSSSSSEELSASDTSDSSGSKVTLSSVVSSSSETPSRPWACIASEGENKRDSSSPVSETYSNSVTTPSNKHENEAKDSASLSSSPGVQTKSSSAAETPGSNSQEDNSTNSTEDLPSQTAQAETTESANEVTHQSKAVDESFGFEPDTSATTEKTAMTNNEENMEPESESDSSSNVSTSDIDSENSTTDSSDTTHTPVVTSGTGLTTTQSHQPVSERIRTYADVVASSTTDSFTHISPLGPMEECDSVAGLERLVDSVEPSPSPVLPISLSSSLSQSSVTASQNIQSPELPSSSPTSDSPLDSVEPQAKRCRLSDEIHSLQPTSTQSSTISSSPADTDTSENFCKNADIVADSSSTDHSALATGVKEENPKESGETAPERTEDTEVATHTEEPSSALESRDQEEQISSPPSQLSSSSDSQGFDVMGAALPKTSTEEGTTNEEVIAGDVPAPEVANDDKSTLEREKEHEPMDQE